MQRREGQPERSVADAPAEALAEQNYHTTARTLTGGELCGVRDPSLRATFPRERFWGIENANTSTFGYIARPTLDAGCRVRQNRSAFGT